MNMRFWAVLVWFFLPLSALAANVSVIDWQYRITFNTAEFLEKCAQDDTCKAQAQVELARPDHSDLQKVWIILFRLRDYYNANNEPDMKAHSYHAMAKLLLSTDDAPIQADGMEHLRPDQYRAQHITNLINSLGHITEANTSSTKIMKWSRIYLALLFREWANHYSSRREEYLRRAYAEIQLAINLKTTRVVYLVAAQLIIDDNYTPPGLTREQAIYQAQNYLRYAFETGHKPNERPVSDVRNPWHWFIKQAKPPYLKDTMRRAAEAVQPVQVVLVNNEAPDELADFDWDALAVLQVDFADLPFRDNDLVFLRVNTAARFPHPIDNSLFQRQNVAGDNMDCFFNAMGWHRGTQVANLAAHVNDPLVRAMVANEIVSMAHNPAQLNLAVRRAIGYGQWQAENATLNLAAAQQMMEGLAILARIQANDAALKRRALSASAFNAFAQYLAQNGTMAGTLVDVADNGIGNFTAIDAMAYLSNVAIRVFRDDGTLIHQYIPQNAVERRYLYLRDEHFQALLPDEVPLVVVEDAPVVIPSVKELEGLYPQIQLVRKYTPTTIRMALFLFDAGNKPGAIGKRLKMDARRVSDILRGNKRCTADKYSKEQNRLLLESMAFAYKDLTEKRIEKTKLAQVIANALPEDSKLQAAQIITYLRNHSKSKTKKTLSKKDSLAIANSYREKKDMWNIVYAQYPEFSLGNILLALSNELQPQEFLNPLELQLELKLGKAQIEKLVVEKFEELKKSQGGTPAILNVSKALKAEKIGYKTVQKILIAKGLMPAQLKAHHLPSETAKLLEEDFLERNPKQGEKHQVYTDLAQKYGVTYSQVKESILNMNDPAPATKATGKKRASTKSWPNPKRARKE